MEYVKSLNLPIDQAYLRIPLFCKQSDYNSRYFQIKLTRGGEIVNAELLGTVTKVAIGIRRPDGTANGFLGTYENGVFTLPLPVWGVEIAGEIKCDVMVWGKKDGGESYLLRSAVFVVSVERSAYAEDDAEKDESVDILTDLIDQVEGLESDIQEAEADRVVAEQGRVAAETARVEAEDGRVEAENARAEAETARASAEAARAAAETARVNAEKSRVTAETDRVNAENLREGNEDARKAAETARAEAETQREDAETGRVEEENARAAAEAARVSAEEERAAAETARESAETSRVNAEKSRVTAETGRVNAENLREENEEARKAAETARTGAEDGRAAAEASRVSAEKGRATAESGREDAETSRVNAETARAAAESERAEAEDGRVEAESARAEAESDRASAEAARASEETARASLETLRVNAEKSRVTAETGRVNAEKARETEFDQKIQACEQATEAAQQVVAEAEQQGITGTVKYDKAQSLTDEQKAQARSNIGAASDSSVELIENNTTLIKNQGGGFAAGDGAETTSGAAIGDGASSTLGAAIGNSAEERGAGGAVGYRAITTGGGGSVGNAANSVKGGAVGQEAKSFNGGAVGYLAESNGSGFAGGELAIARGASCVQLGSGTNNEQNTLQFRSYQICDANGNIPAERLSANSPVKSVNGKTGVVVLAPADIGAATSAQGEKADSAAQPSEEQNWSANQNFNAGFSALNGNFSFSDPTNIGMEIGRKDGTAGTPYIDFHTDGKSGTDYNSRLLATGNQLQITASEGMMLNGNQVLSAIYSKVSFNLNTSYFKQAVDSSGNELTQIWRLFGSQSRVYWVSVNLVTTVQLNGGTSYYMINQFKNKGYEVVTCTVMANNNYVAGRGRINRGGDAFWLDVMKGQTIPAGTNIVCNVFYLSYS